MPIFNTYKKNAKKRGLIFELDFETAVQLFCSPCYYCGAPPSNCYHGKMRDFLYSGIDRASNAIGYTKENCIPCCFTCNKMKGGLSVSEFMMAVQGIYEFSVSLKGQ